MKTFLTAAGLLALPLAVGAQSTTGGLDGVLKVFSNLINLAIPIIIALAVLYFFWGLATFILNAGNEDKRSEGRQIMIYGIIALFVMVSVFGLIRLLQETFGLQGETNPIIPGEIRR